MSTVTVTNSSGIEKATLSLSALEKEEEGLNVTAQARITVNRDELNDISSLQPGEDRVYVDVGGNREFGGILKSPGRSGGKPELIAHSFAEYMRRAQPVPTGQEKVAVDDSTLIQECIDATPQLSAGTIETVRAGETYIFSGVTQLEKARKVAEASGGELIFNPDRTVDYVETRGSDRTSETLSPSNGSFDENTFTVDRDGVAGNTTHLKVYGVGQGTSQVEATVVPADDGASYTNKVTYTNSDWDSGDDRIWDRRTNKDLKNVSALQSWGKTIIEDVQDAEVRIETIVKGTDLSLGDRIHVTNAEEGVDEDLRATELVTLASSKGQRYEVVFSNYSVAHRDPIAEDHKDTGRYNQAFEGDLTQVQQSPGRGPVGPNHDYIVSVYYPDDVVHEVNAQMLIKGLNYRAYSQGAASGGEHTHDIKITHPEHDHIVDLNDLTNRNTEYGKVAESEDSFSAYNISDSSWNTISSFAPSVNTSEVWSYHRWRYVGTEDDGDAIELRVRVEDSSGNYYPDSDGRSTLVAQDSSVLEAKDISIGIPGSYNGNTLELQATVVGPNISSGQDFSGQVNWNAFDVHEHLLDVQKTSATALGSDFLRTSDANGDHTHTPDPGIIDWNGVEQSPELYPKNVDVIVNGSSEGLSLGDGTGPFEEVVDISNTLTQGWNTIRLTSDGLAHLDASFSADLFRQSL